MRKFKFGYEENDGGNNSSKKNSTSTLVKKHSMTWYISPRYGKLKRKHHEAMTFSFTYEVSGREIAHTYDGQ